MIFMPESEREESVDAVPYHSSCGSSFRRPSLRKVDALSLVGQTRRPLARRDQIVNH